MQQYMLTVHSVEGSPEPSAEAGVDGVAGQESEGGSRRAGALQTPPYQFFRKCPRS